MIRLAGAIPAREFSRDLFAALGGSRACTEAAADEVHVCGGGAANGALMRRLAACVAGIPVGTTAAIGLAPQAVEATAFAWLARQRVAREPGNHPAVTGASGLRVLGALHAAPRVRT